MKRAVVTGARGFVGRRWVAWLEARGVEVRAITRRAAAAPERPAGDPFDRAALGRELADARPDRIFHLAGVAHGTDAAAFYLANCAYAAALFDAAADAGLATVPVVLVGTAAEYGPVPAARIPIVEDEPCHPQSHYGISKLAQTQMGQAMARAGRSVMIVRPSNVVGEGMPRHMALSEFAEQVARARRDGRREAGALRTGDLRVVRDFIDVADVCDALGALCAADVPSGAIVNVASGRGVVLGDALARMIALAGGGIAPEPESARMRERDVMAHVSSRAKLESLVGPRPLTPLDESLRAVLRGFDAG
jgi:nucleoside-diphosphate-sugar epimerase